MSHANKLRKTRRDLRTLIKGSGDHMRDDLRIMLIAQAIEDKLGQIKNTDPIAYGNQVISLDLWQSIADECYEVIL